MVHSGFSIVAFLCFFLFFCLTSLANGIVLAADEGTKKGYQNISIDSWINNLDDKIGVTQSTEIHHWAVITTKPGDIYFGVKATLNVYGVPSITNGKSSGAQIWIGNEQTGELMQAGWHVSPDLYGDHQTHFYVHWTAVSFQKTGCYNFHCKGFVRDNTSNFLPGYIIRPLSKYNGDQYEITLKIRKHPETENWELYRGRNADLPVGYWPKSLFKTLDGANRIDIGGTTIFQKGDSSPPMGSGHFASEGEGKAAYLKNIQFINAGDSMYTPDDDAIELKQDRADCYDVAGSVRRSIYFGGPGNCNT